MSNTLAGIGECEEVRFDALDLKSENAGEPEMVTLKEAVKKGNSFLQWAETVLKKGKFDDSLKYAENALQCFQAAFTGISREDILSKFDGSPEAILAFINDSEDNEGLADSLMGEARALLFRADLPRVDPKTAMSDLELSIAVFEKLGDGIGQMKCFRVLGGLKMKAGEVDHAKRYLKASLILAQQGRGEKKVITLDEARTHALLGELSLRTGDEKAAEDHFVRALDRFSRAKSESDMRRKATCLFGIGQIRINQGDDDAAGELFQQSVEIFESLSCERDKMDVLLALANLQLKLHMSSIGEGDEESQLEDLETTEMDFQMCYEYYSKEVRSLETQASIATSLGIIKTMTGDTEPATEYFEIALEAYEKADNKKGMEKTVALMNNLNSLAN